MSKKKGSNSGNSLPQMQGITLASQESSSKNGPQSLA